MTPTLSTSGERTWPVERTWIGRCPGCRRGRRVDTVRRVESGRKTYYETAGGVRCWAPPNEGRIWIHCECGRAHPLEPLSGVYREARACDARCMGATGPNCECQCGGANHGGSWA